MNNLIFSVVTTLLQMQSIKIHTQCPTGKFILDFYCHPIRLAIEIDGAVHDNPEQSEYDEGRTAELEHLGIKVLRFSNDEILQNIDFVIDTIQSIVLSLRQHPEKAESDQYLE